jgi:hypothetical protein
LTRLASFVIFIHEGTSGASFDTSSLVKDASFVTFSTGLESGIAVFAGVIDAVLAFSVKFEESISTFIDTFVSSEDLRGFAFVASVGSITVDTVGFTVEAGKRGSEVGSDGAFLMASIVVQDEGVSTLLADSGVFVTLSAVIDETFFDFSVRLDSVTRVDSFEAVIVSFEPVRLTLLAAEIIVATEASFITLVTSVVSKEESFSAFFDAGVVFKILTSVTVSADVEVVLIASGAGLVDALNAGLAGSDVTLGAFGGTDGAVDEEEFLLAEEALVFAADFAVFSTRYALVSVVSIESIIACFFAFSVLED